MKKGEIWVAELPYSIGSEQSGTRPALILANTTLNVVTVVPMTSNVQALRFPHTLELHPSAKNGLSAVSVLLLFHLRTIDKRRLKKKLGDLEQTKLDEAEVLLKKLLGFND